MLPEIVEYRGQRVIRDFWKHYTAFPDLYDRFALSSVRAVEELDEAFGFADRRVLSVACGTGKDVFEIAQRAHHVMAVDLSLEMLSFAAGRRRELGTQNVSFAAAVAEVLPFRDASFDCALSVFGAPFVGWGWEDLSVRECLRVVDPGGWVAFVSGPGSPDLEPFLRPANFELREVTTEVDYGSVEEALATWGCIQGEAEIDYLLDNATSRLPTRLSIWSRRAGG